MCINKFDIIEKSGAWYTLPGVEKPVQGIDKVYKYLENNPDVLSEIEKVVNEKIK
jgi:hypothetical protein